VARPDGPAHARAPARGRTSPAAAAPRTRAFARRPRSSPPPRPLDPRPHHPSCRLLSPAITPRVISVWGSVHLDALALYINPLEPPHNTHQKAERSLLSPTATHASSAALWATGARSISATLSRAQRCCGSLLARGAHAANSRRNIQDPTRKNATIPHIPHACGNNLTSALFV
jgi:hypothetical protein